MLQSFEEHSAGVNSWIASFLRNCTSANAVKCCYKGERCGVEFSFLTTVRQEFCPQTGHFIIQDSLFAGSPANMR